MSESAVQISSFSKGCIWGLSLLGQSTGHGAEKFFFYIKASNLKYLRVKSARAMGLRQGS